MTIKEGSRVAYAGQIGVGCPAIGDEAKVIASTPDYCHVVWQGGLRRGSIDLISAADLTPLNRMVMPGTVEADLHDTFGFEVVGMRQVFDEAGESGVLNVLAQAGHLSSLAAYAQEALEAVTAQVRTDPSIRRVLADLDADEAESVIEVAAAALLRDAYGTDDQED